MIDRYPSYSPDGRKIAFASDRLGAEEIWILDLETRRSERLELTGDDLGTNTAYWSPDGKRLAVARRFADGKQSVWVAATDGSQADEVVPAAPGVDAGPF